MMIEAQHYSDFHRLIWICGIIGTVGAAVGLCIGFIKWMNALYVKGCEIVGNIMAIKDIKKTSDESAGVVASTKLAVDKIQSNHLFHIEADMKEVARTNLELVKLNTDIRDGIIKLVDRTREA
jgi:hypothetical protein